MEQKAEKLKEMASKGKLGKLGANKDLLSGNKSNLQRDGSQGESWKEGDIVGNQELPQDPDVVAKKINDYIENQ